MNSFLKETKKQCLKTVLQLHKSANAGHIASSLSAMDILTYLFFEKMNPEDLFILSKGHAATALYVVLVKSGRMSEEELMTFYKEGTSLAAHPPCNGLINEIPFGTGSLGHGLSLAAGFSFSQKYTCKKRRIYCLLSDGDCNEGSTWEAALFASQHKLDNLVVIVDYNLLQAFGFARDIINLESLVSKFEAFGFTTVYVDNGNDFESLHKAFEQIEKASAKRPACIVARTTKGSGVSFMENKLEWHYLPMSDEQYQQAIEEIDRYAL